MQKKRPISAYIFTVLIAVAAAIVAYQGLYHINIYRGNSTYLVDLLRGRDSITLYIGVPLLVISGFLTFRHSNRAYLAWLGVLCYFMATYLWYACGIEYNKFFIIYVMLFICSLFSLIRALLAVDVELFCLRFSPKTPIKFLAVFMFSSGLALAYQWIHPILPAISVGSQPDLLLNYGSTAMINFVLNLGIISPLAIITSPWIWKRKPWGYIITSILLLYGLTTNLAFLATQLIIYNRGGMVIMNEIMLYGIVTLLILILWGYFLKNLHEEVIQDYRSRISTMV